MNEDWRFQISLKLGPDKSALLNIRANDIADFAQALRDLHSNAPEIAAAASCFEAHKPPAREPGEDMDEAANAYVEATVRNLAPITAPFPPPARLPVSNGELGPLTIKGEAKAFIAKTGRSAGKASQRYVCTAGGITASTFDTLLGSIVLQLNGKQGYITVDKKPNGFYDLTGIRPA